MLRHCLCHWSLLISVCLALNDFGDPKYWDDAYAADKASTEWYKADLTEVLSSIDELLVSSKRWSMPDKQVLHVGCGISSWSTGLADLGWNVTNIDISAAAIGKMQQRVAEHSRLRFRVMDVTNLALPDDSFDVMFDKGTLHALGSNAASRPLRQGMLAESVRILRAGGIIILISGSVTGSDANQEVVRNDPNLRWLGERIIENKPDLTRWEKYYGGDDKVPSYLKKSDYVHVVVAQSSWGQVEL